MLDAQMTEQERAASDEYVQLEAQLADVRGQTDEALESVFTRDEFPDFVSSLTNVEVEEDI